MADQRPIDLRTERTAARSDKSVPTLVTELRELVVSYAKQETIEPFKTLGKQLGFGVGGAFLLGLGGIFGSVAVLRALQSETGEHFHGRWSWFPYLVTLIVMVIAGVGAMTAARKKGK